MHTKKWFTNRIGKRIYRGAVSCDCDTCTRVTEEGLIVFDNFHATHLFDVQHELNIKYRDKKHERLNERGKKI